MPMFSGYQKTGYKRRRLSYKVKKQLRKYRNHKRAESKYRKMVIERYPIGSDESKNHWGASYAEATDLQKAYRRATGFRGKGDYSLVQGSMQENQLIKGSGDKPLLVNSSGDLTGDVYLTHREFVGNVQAIVPAGGTGPSQFSLVSFPINAALNSTFPWLSQVAENFTLYEFDGLVFEYRPTSGEFGTTGSNALGKIIMATQYDPDAPNFSNSVQMENYDYANACKPSEHAVHGVETANRQKATNMLYCRSGATLKDKIFTDLGVFQIATEGIQVSGLVAGSAVNVGELWVSYRIKLSRAALNSTQLGLANSMDFLNTTPATGSATSMYPNPFNSLGVQVTCSGTTGSALYFVFPSNITGGYYQIDVQNTALVARSSTFSTTLSLITYCQPFVLYRSYSGIGSTQATALTVSSGSASSAVAVSPDPAASCVNSRGTFWVKVTAPGTAQATVQINSTTNWLNTDYIQVTITQIPRNLVAF